MKAILEPAVLFADDADSGAFRDKKEKIKLIQALIESKDKVQGIR